MKINHTNFYIDSAKLTQAIFVLKAVNHKLRQRIIYLLSINYKITITDIYIKLRLDRKIVSQHLFILKKAGVISMEKAGRLNYYSLNIERIEKIARIAKELSSITF